MPFKYLDVDVITESGNATFANVETYSVASQNTTIYTYGGTVAAFFTMAPPNGSSIQRFPFAAEITGADIQASLFSGTFAPQRGSGYSSATNGFLDQRESGSNLTAIYSFPFASGLGSRFHGDLVVGRHQFSNGGASQGVSGQTHGFVMGDCVGPPSSPTANSIDRFPYASGTGAATHANLTNPGSVHTQQGVAGCTSYVNGYACGVAPYGSNKLERFPLTATTLVTAVNLGTIGPQGGYNVTTHSSTTHGYTSASMGYAGLQSAIQKFPFASEAPVAGAIIGYLTINGGNGSVGKPGASSSTNYGYVAGGVASWQATGIVNRFPFASDTNAVEIGDIIAAATGLSGHQD